MGNFLTLTVANARPSIAAKGWLDKCRVGLLSRQLDHKELGPVTAYAYALESSSGKHSTGNTHQLVILAEPPEGVLGIKERDAFFGASFSKEAEVIMGGTVVAGCYGLAMDYCDCVVAILSPTDLADMSVTTSPSPVPVGDPSNIVPNVNYLAGAVVTLVRQDPKNHVVAYASGYNAHHIHTAWRAAGKLDAKQKGQMAIYNEAMLAAKDAPAATSPATRKLYRQVEECFFHTIHLVLGDAAERIMARVRVLFPALVELLQHAVGHRFFLWHQSLLQEMGLGGTTGFDPDHALSKMLVMAFCSANGIKVLDLYEAMAHLGISADPAPWSRGLREQFLLTTVAFTVQKFDTLVLVVALFLGLIPARVDEVPPLQAFVHRTDAGVMQLQALVSTPGECVRPSLWTWLKSRCSLWGILGYGTEWQAASGEKSAAALLQSAKDKFTSIQAAPLAPSISSVAANVLKHPHLLKGYGQRRQRFSLGVMSVAANNAANGIDWLASAADLEQTLAAHGGMLEACDWALELIYEAVTSNPLHPGLLFCYDRICVGADEVILPFLLGRHMPDSLDAEVMLLQLEVNARRDRMLKRWQYSLAQCASARDAHKQRTDMTLSAAVSSSPPPSAAAAAKGLDGEQAGGDSPSAARRLFHDGTPQAGTSSPPPPPAAVASSGGGGSDGGGAEAVAGQGGSPQQAALPGSSSGGRQVAAGSSSPTGRHIAIRSPAKPLDLAGCLQEEMVMGLLRSGSKLAMPLGEALLAARGASSPSPMDISPPRGVPSPLPAALLPAATPFSAAAVTPQQASAVTGTAAGSAQVLPLGGGLLLQLVDATAEGVLPPDGQGLFLRPLTLTAAEGQASTAWGVVGSQYAISASSTSSKPAVAAGGSSGMPTPSTPAAAAGSSAAGSSPLLPGGVAAGAALLLALQRMQPAQVLEEIPVAVQAVMEGPNQQQQAMAALVGAGRPAVECWVEALVPEDTRSRDEVVGQLEDMLMEPIPAPTPA